MLCWQAPGPYTGKGTRADEAELAPIKVTAVEPAAGSAVVKWESKSGYRPIQYNPPSDFAYIATGAAGQRQQSIGDSPIKGVAVLGKVSGNVKFSYVSFS